MSGSVKAGNQMRLFILTLLTGAFAGAIVWCFLKAVSFGTILIWEVIPSGTGTRFILPALCAAGGLITGVIHHFAGNYPDELNVVLYKVKKEKYYDYRHLAAMLGCAFLPLVFGSSVGPEAGLTGIIAALCYWVGDNVTFARNYSALYSAVGEAVTLGQLFHSPLFGIFAVEESSDEEAPDREPMPKIWKLALYSLSTAASFGAVALLNFLFGKAMSGFPSFSEVSPSAKDYILLVLYFAVGFLMYLFYEGSEHVLEKVSRIIPGIVRETLCGMMIGITGLLIPFVLFSGEEQMADLMKELDVAAVIVGNMGPEAKAALLAYGIVPVVGYSGDADTASDLLVTGQLPVSPGNEYGGCGCSCGGDHGEGGCSCGCGGDHGEGGCSCGCGGGYDGAEEDNW